MKIKIINFKDGVYLAGDVKQTLGTGIVGNQGAQGVTGIARAEAIESFDAGVIVSYKGRDFFVPWTSIASCELYREPVEVPVQAEASEA